MILRCDASWHALVAIPGDYRLSLRKVRSTLGCGEVKLASRRQVEGITGYSVGAVSVIGLRHGGLLTFVDRSVLELDQVVISSGRRSAVLWLSTEDLMTAMEGAQVGSFCKRGGNR